MPYEKHHMRLVRLMDTLLETLERDPDFRSFHLDGQTIILEDYLQVRPEKREELRKRIQEGRLIIGPWYILQDEFLTSSESNVRNLLVGHRDAKQYGPVAKIGYFPDSFGNMGQAPQLIAQAGINVAVFGRGVKPVGADNTVQELDHYESPYSEMIWRSPDGTEVLGVLFANWYHNGMEVPVNPEEARRYWDGRIAAVQRFASTNHLLFMNGCDHQPVQTDLSAALTTARNLYPDLVFIHSSFPEYIAALEKAVDRSKLAVIEGELRSQRTDGWTTLVNTASSRVYIKQANQRCQTLLEKVAEPLAAFAHAHGHAYPHAMLNYAWKTLMQNHPHDSICGCSVDEVHREMMTRFAKAEHVADTIIEEAAQALAAQIDTSAFAAYEGAVPFVVFNTSGTERSGAVTVELNVDTRSLYDPSPEGAAAALAAKPLPAGYVVDHLGNVTAAVSKDLGVRFDYTLPDDRFRQPFMARKLEVTVDARQVPALGYRVYAWVPGEPGASADAESLVSGPRTLENSRLRAAIREDGTVDLLHKATGREYTGLNAYENTGDIGNEYIYKQDSGNAALTTRGLQARIELVEDTPMRAAFEIVHEWAIPASADARLQEEIETMVPLTRRQAGRSGETVPFVIRTRVILERDADRLQFRTTVNNQAKDHRLRALFPTDIASDVHYADSIFEIAKRNNVPAPEWKNPSNCQHQQAFVAVDHDQEGLLVANIGLNEYEVLRDGRNTIAVTLLRAVGELGDWGVFRTPEAQCQGEYTLEYAVIPYAGSQARYRAAKEAYQWQIPWTAAQAGVQEGDLPAEHAWMSWSGDTLALSAVKRNEDTNDLIVRWYNLAAEPAELSVYAPQGSRQLYLSNVLEEERGTKWPCDRQSAVAIEVKPAEIITVGIR
jgi:alpha-mannosidase